MTEIVIGGDMEDIPEGTYPATCKGRTVKHSDKYDNDFAAWDFELENGSMVGGTSSTATISKSKGGKWIAALLGRVPAKGEKVDVIGRPCLVQVVDKDGWPAVGAVLPPMKVTIVPVSPAEVKAIAEERMVPAAVPELP